MLSHSIIANALAAAFAEPVFLATLDGRYAGENEAFRARFGLGEEELRGRILPELFAESLAPDGMIPLEISLPRIAGAVKMVVKPLLSRKVAIGYYARLEEDALREPMLEDAAAVAERAIEALPFGLTLWDAGDKLVVANRQVIDRYATYGVALRPGADRVEFVLSAVRSGLFGQKYVGLTIPAQEFSKRRWFSRPFISGASTIERMADGDWMKITSHVCESGFIVSFYEVVDEPKQSHITPGPTAEYFLTLLRYLPDFVVHMDLDGKPEFINAPFAEALGLEGWDSGRSLSAEFFADTFGTSLRDVVHNLKVDGPPVKFDQRLRKADNTFVWLRWSAHGLFHGDMPVGIIATGRNITVEYSQQQELKHQSEELAKKNKSLEQFAAVVSHDLKAPLRHISVFSDMIVEESASGNLADVQVYAQQVRNSAQRMDRVIRRLLEYSQIAYKIAAFSRVNLADIAIQAIQNLESQIDEAKAELLLSKLPSINGDPDLMRHLMQNLIANAVKYRRKGVTPRVRIYATDKGAMVNLVVEDNGIGVDPKFADRIFTAFQRLHSDDKIYEGFGIGLALCRQIAESHRGVIELDSTYRGGARFIVRLPQDLNH
ncbi:PAS domain-containing sensor histidine kinase [Rhizobium sp. C4]|uniref:PAS domain-containing sensor histidine kinase n=1 Tax=Rhizobium sp. C4 TaxID=1349800 RepID=UPI001E52027E|nr:ATP-binding protein [Rhizobium sp. C4]MCD2175207.1 ATP-binding protein [Rhizobium sp. C4]